MAKSKKEVKKVVAEKVVAKKVVGYNVTKPNGNTIYRDASIMGEHKVNKYESKGWKVEEVAE